MKLLNLGLGCPSSLPSTDHLNAGFLAGGKAPSSNTQVNEEINIASSDSEVEIVGVQEHVRY